MIRLSTVSVALFLGAVLFCGCTDAAETPATDSPSVEGDPDVETSAAVVDMGDIKAGVIVEKSTADSESAFVASTTVQALTATVVSIDLETRKVVLMGESGVELEVIANNMTNNLDQVSPGDTVNAKVVERVSIELVKGDDLQAMDLNIDGSTQAEDGEMPARAEIETTVNVYTVEAIDFGANTFKLRNAEGEVDEFTAQDPANLAKAAIGDAVVVTTTEAIAVEVIKATVD
jgi:hypothetical protein